MRKKGDETERENEQIFAHLLVDIPVSEIFDELVPGEMSSGYIHPHFQLSPLMPIDFIGISNLYTHTHRI